MKYTMKSFIPDFNSEEAVKSEFCQKMKNYLNCRYVIPVTNGTAAIEIILRGLRLKRGDHVIIPDISFIATAAAVANCGLIPVYADVSGEYFGLTLENLKNRFTTKVKAVILVHFSGIVNREIYAIKNFCSQNGLVLIEDCAQAFAGTADGLKTGTLGDAGTFSFQSSKIINSGEGGLITTQDEELAAECEAISNWGMSAHRPQRTLALASSNFRLSAIQCYLLTRQLEVIDEILQKRLDTCKELKAECEKTGLEVCLPEEQENFAEYPFFFPVKSSRKIHTVEPQAESPMHCSTIVPYIFKKFFPDLENQYREVNPDSFFTGYQSLNVINEIDFINIHQAEKQSASKIISAYKKVKPLNRVFGSPAVGTGK